MKIEYLVEWPGLPLWGQKIEDNKDITYAYFSFLGDFHLFYYFACDILVMNKMKKMIRLFAKIQISDIQIILKKYYF